MVFNDVGKFIFGVVGLVIVVGIGGMMWFVIVGMFGEFIFFGVGGVIVGGLNLYGFGYLFGFV